MDKDIYDFVYARYCRNCITAFEQRIRSGYGDDIWKHWIDKACEDIEILSLLGAPSIEGKRLPIQFANFSRALHYLSVREYAIYQDKKMEARIKRCFRKEEGE